MNICRITLISSPDTHACCTEETEQRLSIVSTGQIWFTSYRGKEIVRRIRCCFARESAGQILDMLSDLACCGNEDGERNVLWEALVTDGNGKDHYLSGGRSERTARLSEMLRQQLAIRGLMAFDGLDPAQI